MRKLIKALGLAAVITTILVVALAGVALAAGPEGSCVQLQNQTQTQTQTQTQVQTQTQTQTQSQTQTRNMLQSGTCEEYSLEDCVPNDYCYNYDYSIQGPNGFQKGK